MQPHPVPTSATTPRIPHPASRIPVSRSANCTNPSVSGRGIRARASSFSSSVRKPVRPTAYANGTPPARCSTAGQTRSKSGAPGSRSRCSHTSPGLVPAPATAAHSIVASRRERGRPDAARRSAASFRAAPIEAECAAGSGTEALVLTRHPQDVDQGVEVAVHHLLKIVNRVVNAVIGDAVLGKVVRADLLGSVAGAHLGPSLAGACRFLLGAPLGEQARARRLARPDVALELRVLVRHLD